LSGQTNDIKKDTWYTLTEAAQILGVSIRTLQRRIDKGEYKSKKQGHNRMVLLPEHDTSHDIKSDIIATLKQNVKHLEAELEETKTRFRQAEEEAKNKDELLTKERERHDTIAVQKDAIIMQLTRQLGDAQKALEYHKAPWWRRLRLSKGKEENKV
jgi:molecular chaperone GrpE (heat shock protein)